MFDQCNDAGDPSVCELCLVECLLGFRITRSVPGHAVVAEGEQHLHAQYSVRRAEKERPESTKCRVRSRERTCFCRAVRRESEPVKIGALHGAALVCGMLLNGFLVPRCGAMHSAPWLHGIRSVPTLAALSGVPFR
ncbi:ribonuclease HI [Trypanosoma cruzi]|nr:ribonuclease HI [Trypanosoma cruzi]